MELGPDSGGTKASGNSPCGGDADFLKQENVLHGNQLTFHTDTFGDGAYAAGTVAIARDLNEQIDGGADLLADRTDAHVGVRHADQYFEARHRVARGICVNGGE